jgi:hypothetical protein
VRSGIGFAARLLALDAADPALPLEPSLIGLATIGRVAQTSEAVLSLVTASRNMRPSKRAASVTLPLRMKRQVRQIDTLLS